MEEGQNYVIIDHGQPIARIIPVQNDAATARKARSMLLTHLRSQPALHAGSWTREELYETEK